MKIKKLSALLVSAVLCAGMAAPAFAFEGEATPVEQPILPEVVEDVVTVTDETSGALTPEGNLTLVDDYHTNYSDGSGQQFITLVSKSGATFYLVSAPLGKGPAAVAGLRCRHGQSCGSRGTECRSPPFHIGKAGSTGK